MASTLNINTMKLEENILKGARRSRLSFHFNTLRRRRWLLVQLVTAPVETYVQEDAPLQRVADIQAARPCPITKLVDDFRTSQAIKHWA